MSTPARVAIFGGTFDPPHFGHVSVVAYVLTCLGWDTVLVVPCYVHPFGKEARPFEARLRMAQLAFRVFGPRVSVLEVEAHLPRPSYTIRTVEYLKGQYPSTQFGLVVGSDEAAQRHRWYRFEELQRMVELVVLPRQKTLQAADPGPTPAVAIFPDISSTEVRQALARGEDVAWAVPAEVLEFIRQERLYV